MKSDAFDKIPEYDLRNKQDPCENEIGYSPKLEGEDSDYYGFRKLSGKETLYDVGFTLIGVQGGRYHGAVTEINENEILVVRKEEKDEKGETVYITEPIDVNTLILGDYITYIGTETDTNLVEGGRLTTSTLYEWVGKSSDRLYMWKQDLMSEHCGGSLSDALAVSNESLAQNNSTAFQFLDHLTANSIFVNKLVANDAFIKNLFVKQIELQTEYNSDGTVKQYGAIYGGNRYNADGTIKEGSTEETEGFHISSSGLIQANKAVFQGDINCEKLSINNIKGSPLGQPYYKVCTFLGFAQNNFYGTFNNKFVRLNYRRLFSFNGTINYSLSPYNLVMTCLTGTISNVSASLYIRDEDGHVRHTLQIRVSSTTEDTYTFYTVNDGNSIEIKNGDYSELTINATINTNNGFKVDDIRNFKGRTNGFYISKENPLLRSLAMASTLDSFEIT